ncbi:MAG TPA: histidine--tRNA ligase [Bacteroidales bacterium]|jgi:histidyl-tRNA synthetase|nr:histidine--tRNA ligase [Bacteroidota bacterium]HJN06855.1 histidine--tRNA ligase [Bacteroidales bacterium]
MVQKPSIPKGTRDFSPEQMMRRNYIFDTIRTIFQKYGYEPIETPAMENLSSLTGKYGEEGDRLIFKVLNSGDFLKNVNPELLSTINSIKLTSEIAEKGLRYDLTVPFARYVVQNRNDITFPFKRYQIQPVWRADKPQKGRYREFYQCDIDVIGSNSLLNEVELIRIIDEVFEKLNIKATIKLNNRKILSAIAQIIDAPDKLVEITTAIDKLGKIGINKVNEELLRKGLTQEKIEFIKPIINLAGSNITKINNLKELLVDNEDGTQGITELQTIINLIEDLKLSAKVVIDLSLARGLNYYTGAIIEVVADDVEIGSICGGGRYDDLTGIFGLPDTSGVGISFGADRIYDVMKEKQLFKEQIQSTTQVMLVNFGGTEGIYALSVLAEIQKAGIRAELYPDSAKMKKQMKYADKKSISNVLLIGDEEMKSGYYTLKNMNTGEQQKVNLTELITILKD